MKARDIEIIIVLAIISAVASILVSNFFFSTPEDRRQTVETAETITTNFDRPSTDYFNQNSFNPAQEIEVGQDPGSNPFRAR